MRSHYLTTSMEAAPDLKKSVESSILATLVRMLCQTAFGGTVSLAVETLSANKYIFFCCRWMKTYPHLFSKGFFLLCELHSCTASCAEVLCSSDHLPIFKLEILHQQLQNRKVGFG